MRGDLPEEVVHPTPGPSSEIVATFAWVLAVSFVATGSLLIAAAPVEAGERETLAGQD